MRAIAQTDLDRVWNMIKPMRMGMLVTQDDGAIRARPMGLVQEEFEGKIYFFTEPDTQKAQEINDERQVCLAFSDLENQNYVSLSGTARMVRNQVLIDQFWNAFIAAWFPQGKDSLATTLIEVTVQKGEYWDGITNKLQVLFEVAKANMTKEKPDMGENRKVG